MSTPTSSAPLLQRIDQQAICEYDAVVAAARSAQALLDHLCLLAAESSGDLAELFDEEAALFDQLDLPLQTIESLVLDKARLMAALRLISEGSAEAATLAATALALVQREPAPEPTSTTESGKVPEPSVLHDMLSLVHLGSLAYGNASYADLIPLATVQGWSDAERVAVAAWLSFQIAKANDCVVVMKHQNVGMSEFALDVLPEPAMPSCVEQALESFETDECLFGLYGWPTAYPYDTPEAIGIANGKEARRRNNMLAAAGDNRRWLPVREQREGA